MKRLEAYCVHRNQIVEMKLHCHRILAANSNQIGNLRVAESAGEANESMFRFIDDFDPAFHKSAGGQESGHARRRSV